jgi:hypothetical protein
MLATNLVYATVVGRYPRLLADDGVHEALVLPYSVDGFVNLEFYREGDKAPIGISSVFSAGYIRPDGTVGSLAYALAANRIEVRFPADLPAGGVCVIRFKPPDSDRLHECYPFRVLRPTETHTSFTSNLPDT